MEIKDLIEQDATAKALADFANAAPKELDMWQSASGCWMVPTEWLRPDKDARQTYDEEEDRVFKNGIAEQRAKGEGIEGTGIDTPLLIRPDPANPSRFLVKAGRRRWRMSEELGTPFLPCAIRDASNREAYRIAVRENVARSGLSPVEEGDAYLEMQGEGDSVAVIATEMNKSQGYINNRLRMARKPEDIKEMVQIATTATHSVMAHADAIDTVKSDTERARLIEMVIKEKAPLEKIKKEVTELDKRGLVKSKTYGSSAPVNTTTTTRSINVGTIGKATSPAKVYVDWKGLSRAGKDATWNIRRNCRDNKPTTKENRDLMLDTLAAMEKDIKEAKQLLGPEID